MSNAGDARLSELDDLLDAAVLGQSGDQQGIVGKLLDLVPGVAADATPPGSIADDLFGVVDALDSSPSLRRALTDPNAPDARRQALAHALLDGKVSKAAAGLVAEAVALRWAGGRTLADALERQAVRAELIKADAAGELDDTEDALFRLARMVESSPDLRNTLSDRRLRLKDRQGLMGELLEGRVTASTMLLARRAVAARRRTFGLTIEGYSTLAAAQRNRVVATVRVATPMSPEHSRRLRDVLSRQVGRDVVIQEVIDEAVLGGVRVELGSEIIEGTVQSRLDEARRMFG